MTLNEEKAVAFLKEHLYAFKEEEYKWRQYRFEHSLRVASIGEEIALKENLDKESLVLACILHDVGKYDTNVDVDHGRVSAKIAREFLKTLDIEKDKIDEICFGIAIHVDDKADFEYKRTVLSESVSDCDNIDRFDTFRIYDNLAYNKLEEKSTEEVISYIDNNLKKLNKYLKMKLATKTATKMWEEKISFQITFFTRLKEQYSIGMKWKENNA